MTPWARTNDTFIRWLIWRSTWWTIRLTIAPMLRTRVTGVDRIPKTGGAMVLPNHTTFWDFLICFWGVYRPVRGIGSEQPFRIPVVGTVLKTLGAIPFSKGAKDGAAVRQLVAAYEAGSIIGMFPEGERSWTGHPVGVKRGTGRLVKSLGCPVIYCQVTTGHLHHPRWATWPRMIPWRMEYSEPEVFSPDATVDEINDALDRGLDIKPDQITLPPGSRGWRLADGLPDYLWACPACFAHESLSVTKDRDCVVCSACQKLWRIDLLMTLTGETPDTPDWPLHEAHARLIAHYPTTTPLTCPSMSVARVQRGRLRKTAVITGAASLTDTGLEVRAADGELWSLPYADMRVVLLQIGNKLQIRIEGGNLQLNPVDQSTLRWQHFLQARIKAQRSALESSTS